MNTPQAGVYIAGVQKLIDNGLINEDMLKQCLVTMNIKI